MTARLTLVLLALFPLLPAQTRDGFSALAARAAAAREAHRIDEAAQLYRKALALRPRWEEGWWYLGTLLYDRDSYAAAADAFRQAAAINPTNGTALAMLGLCEFELGREDLALRHLQRGLRAAIAGTEQLRNVVVFREAALLQRRGRFEDARERLHALCRSGAASPELDRTLGMVALREKGPTPSDAQVAARTGRAQCLAGQKKYDEARAAYRALAAERPLFPNLHYAFGRFLVEAGDIAGGIEELERELRRDPAHTTARLQIAAAYYKVDSAAGLRYAEEAVRTDPAVPLGHYLLGLLLLDTDDYARAIPELETARRSFPKEPRLLLALSSAYARAGREQDAARTRAEFQRLQKQQPAPP